MLPIAATLNESLEHDELLLPELAPLDRREPFRAKCSTIAARLRRTLDYVQSHKPQWAVDKFDPPPAVYLRRDDLLADLNTIESSLRLVGAEASADGLLHDFKRLVDTFGLHMLTLDIREHSQRLRSAVAEILHRRASFRTIKDSRRTSDSTC